MTRHDKTTQEFILTNAHLKNHDVIIIGGGMVGLAQAIALAQNDLQVAVVETQAHAFDVVAEPLTARVSAINLASIEFLQSINISLDAARIGILRKLTVWDDVTGAEIEFDCADINKNKLGVIVENRELVALLEQRAKRLNIQFYLNDAPKQITIDENYAQLILHSDTMLQAKLIIGADGARSWVREQLQINTRERSYCQQAIICCLQTEKPHEFTGWQNFLTTGPLALLPLQDKNQCAIVWSNDDARAKELMQMNLADFTIELNNAFGARLGEITAITERNLFPLTMRHAQNYVHARVALIGDAAHAIHPLAGQGVNLGFADVVALTDKLGSGPLVSDPIPLYKKLRQYERARKEANTLMLAAMRGFKELFGSKNSLVQQARAIGLKTINKFDFVKRFFIM